MSSVGDQPSVTVHLTEDAIINIVCIEIDKYTNTLFGYAQISQKLLVMNRLQLFHRFQFYYHRFLHEDVKSEVYRKYDAVIHDIKFHLALNGQTVLAQLMA